MSEEKTRKHSNKLSDIDDVAWRQAVKDWFYEIVPERFSDIDDCQRIHTPYELCAKILTKLRERAELTGKSYLVFNIEFAEVLIHCFGIDSGDVTFVTDNEQKAKFAKTERYRGMTVMTTEFNNGLDDNPWGKKFDVVIMNPPYQTKASDEFKKTQSIWDKFVFKVFEVLKKDGYLCAVHPAGWRNVSGKFKKVQELLKSKQMEYLEIHDIKDGQKTFGASTRYDWYVAKNCLNEGKTLIHAQDGMESKVNIGKMDFIPNGQSEEVASFIAKDGEETVEILYSRSAYGSDKKNMSKEQDDEYKYPCLQNVNVKNVPSCVKYSNTKNKGHFGIPKVISGSKVCGVLVDKTGEYGLCQHCFGIIDNIENLENIAKAMKSEKFIKLMKFCDVGGGCDRYNRKVIATFRKDFWKEFVK